MQSGQSSEESASSRAEIAAIEYPYRQEWIGDEELLTGGLVVLAPDEALRSDVLERVVKAARAAAEPEEALDLVTPTICWVLHDKVPADLVRSGRANPARARGDDGLIGAWVG